jgi:hypothetical protein
MTFKNDFLAALQAGNDYLALLDVVNRHQAQGLSPETAYEVLQQIWLEYGFDDSREGGDLQNNLEAVMEKVWYQCPA